MRFNKGTWTTVAVAAIVAVIVTLLVERVDDWTRALNTDFLVYGQSPGGGGTTGQTGTGGQVTVNRIVPQVAVGNFDAATKFSTIIQVVNTGTTSVTLSGNVFTQAGAASPINFRTSASDLATFRDTLPSRTLPPNGSIVLTADTDTSPNVGWGRITASNAVTVSTIFEVRDPTTNVLKSRVGVAPSPDNMEKFIIPRMRNVAAGLDVGFALVNNGSTAASITATLFDSSGVQLGTRSISLAARGHTAQFAREFFSLTNEPAGTNFSFIVFESTTPAFSAVALAFEGLNQTSFPVDRIR